jgi:PPP family 3-phenylpropionic acid transporter
MAVSAFYAFIGNFFDESVGIPKKYIGLVINIGVVIEVGFTLIMPWMQRKIDLKGIMVLGLFCMALRMILLAFFPTPAMAVVVQLCHGLEVLALFVGPVMFLDRLATDEFRNSIHGVFTMVIGGVARVVGGVAAGLIVMRFGLQGGLLYGAGLSFCSFLIIAFLFHRIPPRSEIHENAVSSVDSS